jgi:hypothetical protein
MGMRIAWMCVCGAKCKIRGIEKASDFTATRLREEVEAM